jgi:hypothetical protein
MQLMGDVHRRGRAGREALLEDVQRVPLTQRGGEQDWRRRAVQQRAVHVDDVRSHDRSRTEGGDAVAPSQSRLIEYSSNIATACLGDSGFADVA